MFKWIPLRRAAAIAGIVIVSLMIAGTISVTVDDAWLWALLALYAVCLLARGRGRARLWEQRWWWEFDDRESAHGREPHTAPPD